MSKKFALVTGASTGIGRALAIELGKLKWKVGLVGRNEEKIQETEKLVKEAGGESVTFFADLTNIKDIDELINQASIETDNIDLIANVAGIWHGESEVYAGRDITDFPPDVIADTYSVGVVAPTIIVSGLISLMPSGASIINLSGTFENGAKGWIPYYVSKRAIEDLTVGLSEELKDKGIKVNCISPSDTSTEEYKKYFPEDALGAQTPEQVAKLFIEVVNKEETGKVYVIKNGEVYEWFHK